MFLNNVLLEINRRQLEPRTRVQHFYLHNRYPNHFCGLSADVRLDVVGLGSTLSRLLIQLSLNLKTSSRLTSRPTRKVFLNYLRGIMSLSVEYSSNPMVSTIYRSHPISCDFFDLHPASSVLNFDLLTFDYAAKTRWLALITTSIDKITIKPRLKSPSRMPNTRDVLVCQLAMIKPAP